MSSSSSCCGGGGGGAISTKKDENSNKTPNSGGSPAGSPAVVLVDTDIHKAVREAYGKRITTAGTDGCCGRSSISSSDKKDNKSAIERMGYDISSSTDVIDNIVDDNDIGLGCGSPIKAARVQRGDVILDLGSGAGFDAFLASKETGSTGKVIGVDMTPEMIQKATFNAKKRNERRYNNMIKNSSNDGDAALVALDYSPVEFRLGYIEQLPIDDNSIDVIISNCVINLSPNKKQVFHEAYRVLKEKKDPSTCSSSGSTAAAVVTDSNSKNKKKEQQDGSCCCDGGDTTTTSSSSSRTTNDYYYSRIAVSDIVISKKLPDAVAKNMATYCGCIAGASLLDDYIGYIQDAGFVDIQFTKKRAFDVLDTSDPVVLAAIDGFNNTTTENNNDNNNSNKEEKVDGTTTTTTTGCCGGGGGGNSGSNIIGNNNNNNAGEQTSSSLEELKDSILSITVVAYKK